MPTHLSEQELNILDEFVRRDAEKSLQKLRITLIVLPDWIMSATTSSYERLTMAQLDSAREFCHSHVPGYPGLYAAWMSQGESVFQERQAVEHRKFVAAMAW